MVAAVDELTIRRRPQQALTLIELVVWIGAALLVLRAAGVPLTLSIGHSVGAALLAGALLLGVGARVNGACLLGTLARLGSGQWAYAATPLGYWAGSGLAAVGPAMPMPEAPGRVAPLFQLPAAAAALLVLAALASAGWRWRLAAAEARSAGADRRSTYRAALLSSGGTALVALGFVTLAALAGAWSYSDLLADLAKGLAAGMAAMLNEGWVARAALAVALFAGALWAGARAGLWRPERPRAVQIARCAAGGALMGLGGAWVPGGNDQLLLLALPMGWPHALVALLVMTLGIVATGGAARLLMRSGVS
jgi:toxin CptA